jgi:hypothetical protein
MLRELGDAYNAAGTLERLGDSCTTLGEPAEALAARCEALWMYQEQGRADDAARVQATLAR